MATQLPLFSPPRPEAGAPVPPRFSDTDFKRPNIRLSPVELNKEGAMGRILKRLRYASGLTTREIAERMGIQKSSLHQHLWERNGQGGSGRIDWFCRYIEACGGRLYLALPSIKEQYELLSEHGKIPPSPSKSPEHLRSRATRPPAPRRNSPRRSGPYLSPFQRERRGG